MRFYNYRRQRQWWKTNHGPWGTLVALVSGVVQWLRTDTWWDGIYNSGIFRFSCLSQSHSGSIQYCVPCFIFSPLIKTDIHINKDDLKNYFSNFWKCQVSFSKCCPLDLWANLQTGSRPPCLPLARSMTPPCKGQFLLNLPHQLSSVWWHLSLWQSHTAKPVRYTASLRVVF